MEVQNGCVSTGPGPLLTESEASSLLAVSVHTLRQWRMRRWGPAFCKIGRVVRYRRSDLDDFISEARVEVRHERR